MRTILWLAGDISFQVKQTAEEIEEEMTQSGPFGLLKFDLTTSDGKLCVDAHSIVAVAEYPDQPF